MNYYAEPGEIITIDKFINERGEVVNRHSFLVLSSEDGEIEGKKYNLILLLMSSLRGKSQEAIDKNLKYFLNVKVEPIDITTINGNGETAFIKGRILYYFNLEKHQYTTTGNINERVWILLRECMIQYQKIIKRNLNNLNIKEVRPKNQELIKR